MKTIKRIPLGRILLSASCAPPRWSALMLMFLGVTSMGGAGEIEYTYDSAGRLVAEDYGGGKVSSYLYDDNGNLLTNATVIATSADVRIPSISSSATGANAGGTVTYTINVSNNGPHPATVVTLTDPLPFGILFTSASSSQGTCVVTGRTVTCNFGVLLPGTTESVTITGIRAFQGTFTNVAFVTSGISDPNLANNTNSVTVSATAPFDADGDGMPNWWEQMQGLGHIGGNGSGGDNGADGDPDGDGVRNFDEWIGDTDPRDPNSHFHIESLSLNSGVTMLTFQSSPIRRYHAQFTPELNTAFTNLLSFEGTGGGISITHKNNSGGFYRLQAELP